MTNSEYDNNQVDVLIIGGGPAGMAAGIVCARNELLTLVVERQILPAQKACGEGVMPVGVDHLKNLGVIQNLDSQDFHPFKGVRYIGEGGVSVTGLFEGQPGLGIFRPSLSRAFVKTARRFPCLNIVEGKSATPLGKKENRIQVKVGKRIFHTRLLIGADGLNSQVRLWAGLDGPPQRYRRWGAVQHYEITPWTDLVEVYWGHGLEAYITPCGVKRVGVAFLWDPQHYGKTKGGPNLAHSLLSNFPKLAAKLATMNTDGKTLALGPMQRNALLPATEGVVLVGDAAGYLDALTGEGISLAMGHALALEETVIPVLQKKAKGLLTTRELSYYIQANKSINRPYYQSTHLALFFSSHPRFANRAVKALNKQSSLFQHLLFASMGKRKLWPGLAPLLKLGARILLN
jgi:menaquinone-9 beta-reductase